MKIQSSFKKVLNYKSETIFGAGLLMSVLAFLGSLLGIVRYALLASRFGVSHSLDVYYASFRLPDLIYNIFIIGAISAAFIPLFNEYLSKDKEKAWQFSTLIIFCIGCFLTIFGLIIVIFARPLLSMLLVGFDQENLQLAIFLTRIMMIQPILLGVSSIFSGILRSFRLFFVSALAPVMYNLGIIIGIIFFVPLFGLKGLAFGVVLGACFHLFVQLPFVLETGYRFQFFAFSEFTAGFKKLIAIMSTRTSGIIISQLFLVGVTSIATLLKAGTITIFAFVDNILPYTTFALPFADAAFPHLSRLEAERNQIDFMKVFWDTLNHILFFIIPLAIWCIVFREPIVRLLFGYGKFDWQATITTMKVLAYLAIGMIFQSINYYLLKTFFAKKDAKRPFFASLFAYSIGFFFCYKLGIKFGIVGLAGGIIFTYILYSLVLLYFLRNHVNYSLTSLKEFFIKLIKIIIVSAISGLIGYVILSLMTNILSLEKVIHLIIDSGVAFLFSLLVFIILSDRLQIKEIQELKSLVFKRFRNKKNEEHS
ncbi:MAG: murein biosynthesis integral membrane protein MurJ [Candidatus Paceibacterota bacterium]|jgi:putative peptidoglycan lipid II flippase